MEIMIPENLFWFLKEGTRLDLSKRVHRDMYVQQVLTRGRTADVRKLLSTIKVAEFSESLGRIERFLPKGVQRFWEEWLGNFDPSAKTDSSYLQHSSR